MNTSTRPLRVAFITPKNSLSATSRYRVHHLAEALRIADPNAIVTIGAITDNSIALNAPDVVVLHRLRYSGEADRVLAAARKVGAATVASVDDLIFSLEYPIQVGLNSPPDDSAFYRYHRTEADDHLRTLEAVDAVLTSTEFLSKEAQEFLKKPKPIYCLRNALNGEMTTLADAAYAQRKRRLGLNPGIVTLGYLSGSPTHDLDFAEIATPLARIMHRFGHTRLLLVGTVSLPAVLQPFADSGRVRRHPFVPWRDLFGLTAQLDISLAPLDASRLFNHTKSEIKMLEAGAIGVPTVATWTAGVAEVGDNVGLLARTGEDWEASLTRLLEGNAVPRGEAVRAWVRSHATTTTWANETHRIFSEVAAKKTGNGTMSATITRPLREIISQSIRETEAGWMRRHLRLTRHWRLLQAELEKKGL